MGVVYRAHDTRLDRDVAIKVLPTDRPLTQTARRRFQREAMAASALNHPNIITIYEVNSEGNTDFIVMEYVRGATLSSVLKNRKLELSEAIRYCIQIADALTKSHATLLAAVKAGQDLNDIKNEPEFVSLRTDPRYHLTILSAAAAKPDQ
jgi:serine/threonine protein kinase